MTGDGAARGSSATLAVLALVQFTTTAEFTVVYVALPAIVADLRLAPGLAPWVIGAYAVLFAGLLVLGGRVVDRVGSGRVLRVALGGFVVAGALGALAPTGLVLVVARAGQGVASAFLQPAVLGLLTATFPGGPARDRALGVWSGVGAVGLAAGALGGGLLTAVSWRATMAAPIPPALVALVALVALRVPTGPVRTSGPVLPVRSAVLGTGAVLASVGSLTVGTLPLLGPAVAMGAAFVISERRGRAVLVEPVLRRSRSLRVGAAATAVYMAGAGSEYFLLTGFWQDARGYGPVAAGVAFLPLMVATSLGCALAARALGRWDAPVLLGVGFAGVAAGLAWLAVGTGAPFPVLLPALVIGGVGNGLVYTTMMAVGLRDVPATHQGTAGALLTTAQYVASGVAVAALALVLDAGPRAGFAAAAGVSVLGIVLALVARSRLS